MIRLHNAVIIQTVCKNDDHSCRMNLRYSLAQARARLLQLSASAGTRRDAADHAAAHTAVRARSKSRPNRARYLRRRSASFAFALRARDDAKSVRPAALSDGDARHTA